MMMLPERSYLDQIKARKKNTESFWILLRSDSNQFRGLSSCFFFFIFAQSIKSKKKRTNFGPRKYKQNIFVEQIVYWIEIIKFTTSYSSIDHISSIENQMNK